MHAGLRDALWLIVAALALAWAVSGAVLGMREFFDEPDLLAILGFVMLGFVGFWLVGGAWLRTSWGRRYIRRRRSGPGSTVRGNGSQR